MALAEDIARLRAGTLSASDLLDSCLERIEAFEGRLNCFITRFDAETVRARAREIDEDIATSGRIGPLHGVPIGIKDVFDVAGAPTTYGSAAFDDAIAGTSSAAVQKLVSAGAIILGKLTTHEFAAGSTNANERFGQCHNPWDLSRVPGGSSGGPGAAVAAGFCAAALASDAGASIRRPASYCGVTGIAPSIGRVSRAGAFVSAWGFDRIGPIAANMVEAVAMLDAIAGPDPADPASFAEPWEGLLPTLDQSHRIASAAVPHRWIERHCEPGVIAQFEQACSAARAEGIELIDLDIPYDDDLLSAIRLLYMVEFSLAHRPLLASRGERYSAELRTAVQLGEFIPATDYVRAQQFRTEVCRWLRDVFDTCDVILTPTTPTIAPYVPGLLAGDGGPSVTSDTSGIYCALGPISGLPSISIPMRFDRGMPVGLLLTGLRRRERDLIRLAARLENAFPSDRVPSALLQ